MSVLIDRNSKVVCQGITGNQGSFHTEQCIEYGTRVVAGVTPGRGGEQHLGVPVYNTMREAVDETGADVSMIYVPAQIRRRCYPGSGGVRRRPDRLYYRGHSGARHGQSQSRAAR